MSELDSVLKPYTSHKKVRAAEITSIGSENPVTFERPVTLAGRVTLNLPGAMFVRYTPVPGDYLVVYEDGYRSFSPRKQFLEGYKADGESFADIKQGIKDGKTNPDQAKR
jgi:hypothetical protein